MKLDPYTWRLMHQVLASDYNQARDDMSCRHDEAPDNATLHPISFAMKRLSSIDWHHNNIE